MFNLNCSEIYPIKAVHQKWMTKSYSYKNVARPDFGFLYLKKGNMVFSFDDKKLELVPGDIIYLPKDCHYEVFFDISDSPVEDYLINFDVAERETFSMHTSPTVVFNDSNALLLHHFQNARNAYMESSELYFLKAMFYLCIHNVLSLKKSASDALDALLDKAAQMLGESPELSVMDIAKNVGMSRSSLQNKFKKRFGLSPVDYRCKKRIEKVKYLLVTTDMPIKEIADLLGFYDLSYFYRSFEKHCLTTPSTYRKNSLVDI